MKNSTKKAKQRATNQSLRRKDLAGWQHSVLNQSSDSSYLLCSVCSINPLLLFTTIKYLAWNFHLVIADVQTRELDQSKNDLKALSHEEIASCNTSSLQYLIKSARRLFLTEWSDHS